MASTTVANIVIRVKDWNTKLTSAQDDRILRWINDGVRFLTNERQARRWRIGLKHLTTDAQANESLLSLPDYFISVDTVMRLNAAGTYIPAAETNRAQILQWDADGKSYAADEYYYALRGNAIDIRPTPTALLTAGVRISAYTHADDLTNTDELYEFLERWRELLGVYAARNSGVRDRSRRDELEAKYGELTIQFRRNLQRSQQPRRVRTVRSRTNRRSNQFGRIS